MADYYNIARNVEKRAEIVGDCIQPCLVRKRVNFLGCEETLPSLLPDSSGKEGGDGMPSRMNRKSVSFQNCVENVKSEQESEDKVSWMEEGRHYQGMDNGSTNGYNDDNLCTGKRDRLDTGDSINTQMDSKKLNIRGNDQNLNSNLNSQQSERLEGGMNPESSQFSNSDNNLSREYDSEEKTRAFNDAIYPHFESNGMNLPPSLDESPSPTVESFRRVQEKEHNLVYGSCVYCGSRIHKYRNYSGREGIIYHSCRLQYRTD